MFVGKATASGEKGSWEIDVWDERSS